MLGGTRQAGTNSEGRHATEETTVVVGQPSKPPEGVQSFDVGPPGAHTEENIEYAQSPPVGGPHSPVWQNCGFYAEPVRDETAVHSLEHGAVWITYSPDVPQDEIETLRDLAQTNSYVLASLYPGLDSPIVVTAWSKQLSLQSAEDPDLERFVRAYSQGPQAPEPRAPCAGGVGQPQSPPKVACLGLIVLSSAEISPVRTDNTLQVRFSATVGEEPQVEVALV
jgi:hypothetical protein